MQKDILTMDLASPLHRNEYLYRVLICETGSRLIHDDFKSKNITLEQAWKIMIDSVDFGIEMYPDEDSQ